MFHIKIIALLVPVGKVSVSVTSQCWHGLPVHQWYVLLTLWSCAHAHWEAHKNTDIDITCICGSVSWAGAVSHSWLGEAPREARHSLLLSQNPWGSSGRVKLGDTSLPSCHLLTWRMHVWDSESFSFHEPSSSFWLRWKGGMLSSLPARFSVSEAGLEIL